MQFGLRRFRALTLATVLLGAAAPAVSLAVAAMPVQASSGGFNAPGNLLITDQFNNRAIEVNPMTRSIVWSFGSGNPTLCNPGPGSIIGLNDAERLSDGLTLLAGTGVPPGSSPVAPGFSCVDNRVIVVARNGAIVWQYGQAGVTGSGPNQLNVPVFAIQLPNRNIMVVDQGNNRVIEVDRYTKAIVWSYPTALGVGSLNNPNSAELLVNGHILIADENNNRVIEVTRTGQIVWQYGSGNPKATHPLLFAAFASRLANGNTLITDSGHSRIVEVTEDKHVVFEYFTNAASGSNPSPLPTNAVRLANGHISIADQFNHRAIIIDQNGGLLFQYGVTNQPGNAPGQLDGPYTSYAIGDYTGQTVPPPDF
jgi:outer membrane protein assembly factor BamB